MRIFLPFVRAASRWLFGYGFFGLLQFKILIPHVIGQDLWDDMGHSETVIRKNAIIKQRTVIARPGNMYPVSEAATFSEQWHKEGGEIVLSMICLLGKRNYLLEFGLSNVLLLLPFVIY